MTGLFQIQQHCLAIVVYFLYNDSHTFENYLRKSLQLKLNVVKKERK